MKVVFDYQIFTNQKYGGISRYFTSLAQELSELNQAPMIVAPAYINRYLREQRPCAVAGGYVGDLGPGVSRLFMRFNKPLSRALVPFVNPDIVHETYYAQRGVSAGKACRILTVLDMIHELYPKDFSPNDRTSDLKRLAVARADHIISISHNTKRDLCDMWGVPENKVSVVHLGCEPRKVTSSDLSSPLRTPYLLYVGHRSGYKNFMNFLKAVASSPELKRNFSIVAFGSDEFTPLESFQISQLGFRKGSVKHVSGSDEVLARYYRHAHAFVYPSLYEGFGLPPLEAMANECPVVSSNTSSMPEVIGLAAEYFDPASIDNMAAAIENVVFDEERGKQLRILGRARVSQFSWPKCAQETLTVYRDSL